MSWITEELELSLLTWLGWTWLQCYSLEWNHHKADLRSPTRRPTGGHQVDFKWIQWDQRGLNHVKSISCQFPGWFCVVDCCCHQSRLFCTTLSRWKLRSLSTRQRFEVRSGVLVDFGSGLQHYMHTRLQNRPWQRWTSTRSPLVLFRHGSIQAQSVVEITWTFNMMTCKETSSKDPETFEAPKGSLAWRGKPVEVVSTVRLCQSNFLCFQSVSRKHTQQPIRFRLCLSLIWMSTWKSLNPQQMDRTVLQLQNVWCIMLRFRFIILISHVWHVFHAVNISCCQHLSAILIVSSCFFSILPTFLVVYSPRGYPNAMGLVFSQDSPSLQIRALAAGAREVAMEVAEAKSAAIVWQNLWLSHGFPQQNESFIPRFEVFGSSMIV